MCGTCQLVHIVIDLAHYPNIFQYISDMTTFGQIVKTVKIENVCQHWKVDMSLGSYTFRDAMAESFCFAVEM